jgi:hypothetical protein
MKLQMKTVVEYTGLGRNRAGLRHIIYSHRPSLRLAMSGNFCWRITTCFCDSLERVENDYLGT